MITLKKRIQINFAESEKMLAFFGIKIKFPTLLLRGKTMLIKSDSSKKEY